MYQPYLSRDRLPLALRGLDASKLESPKVKVVIGDLFAPEFGLGDSEYKDVSPSRNDPIHGNRWKLSLSQIWDHVTHIAHIGKQSIPLDNDSAY